MSPGEALRIAHQRGLVASPWLPGMANKTGQRAICVDDRGIVRWWASGRSEPWRGGEPFLDDACTLGGFAALVREVTYDPRLSCMFAHSIAAWVVQIDGHRDPTATFEELRIESYVSEADAWVQALYRTLRLVDLGGS